MKKKYFAPGAYAYKLTIMISLSEEDNLMTRYSTEGMFKSAKCRPHCIIGQILSCANASIADLCDIFSKNLKIFDFEVTRLL